MFLQGSDNMAAILTFFLELYCSFPVEKENPII